MLEGSETFNLRTWISALIRYIETRCCRLDYSDELELQKEADEVEQFAMTSLGKLIFVDIHCRHPKSLSADKPSVDIADSLSLAFESLFYMPFDIIENYGNTVRTLDISHNKFSRYVRIKKMFVLRLAGGASVRTVCFFCPLPF